MSANVRPFDWRDLPVIHRYRRQSVFLYSSLVLTRGPMVLTSTLLSYFARGMGIETATCNGNSHARGKGIFNGPLLGQTLQPPGAQFTYLTFLAPANGLDSPYLVDLVDHLVGEAGKRGSLRILADVDESSPIFESLRQVGFAIYSRQRIWQLKPASAREKQVSSMGWRKAASADSLAVRSLYYNLVPGLVQQVEPDPAQNLNGLVCHRDGELLAYVELRNGRHGVWAQPFVHPDAGQVRELLADLLDSLPWRHSRPVYFCVRSYQGWLEPLVQDLGAKPGPRQAVMVKHIALAKKAARTFALPALEGGQPEISAPFARAENHVEEEGQRWRQKFPANL